MKHPKINMHVLPHVHGNLLAARHAGFSAGTADYVSWVDPDDAALDLWWIDEALEILQDPSVSAVYPRWKSTRNGKLSFQVPVHEWHPKYSHMRSLPYAHHLTIMRRQHVQTFFAETFQKIDSAQRDVDSLVARSMQKHGRLVALPAVAYEWKLRDRSARSDPNKGKAASWAASLYAETWSRS